MSAVNSLLAVHQWHLRSLNRTSRLAALCARAAVVCCAGTAVCAAGTAGPGALLQQVNSRRTHTRCWMRPTRRNLPVGDGTHSIRSLKVCRLGQLCLQLAARYCSGTGAQTRAMRLVRGVAGGMQLMRLRPPQLAPTTALALQARSVVVDMEEGVINKMLKVQLPHQGNLRA